MFKDNKYSRIYANLMIRASRRVFLGGAPTPDTYYERHHVIPRCMGGSDELDNYAILTAREHYLAHWLLIKMVDGPEKHKLQFAFFHMCTVGKGQKRTITSSQYAIAKKHMRVACIERNKTAHVGLKRSDEAKERMSNAKRGHTRMHHPEHGIKWVALKDIKKMMNQGYKNGSGINAQGANNAMFGRTHSVETLVKISEAKVGKPWNASDEEKEKRRQRWKDNNPNNDPVAQLKKSRALSKTYIITHVDGTEETVTNMTAYCKDKNLHAGNMSSVAKGRLPHYKGMRVRFA